MSTEKSPKKYSWLNLAIVVVTLVLVILLCVFVFHVPYWSPFKANPNHANDTVEAFAYSLAYNKLDGIKSYVSPDKWTFIDTWSTYHEAISFDCKYPDDPDLGAFWMSSFDDSTQTLSMSFQMSQDCPNYFYMLNIGNIDLKRIDNKWQVINWSEICERTTEERCY